MRLTFAELLAHSPELHRLRDEAQYIGRVGSVEWYREWVQNSVIVRSMVRELAAERGLLPSEVGRVARAGLLDAYNRERARRRTTSAGRNNDFASVPNRVAGARPVAAAGARFE
jgi:hypothetical protein